MSGRLSKWAIPVKTGLCDLSTRPEPVSEPNAMTRKSDIKKTNGSSPEPKDDFEAKLAELPRSPGVYLMKDDAGKIIYVGKAKSLRDRVRSYVNETDTRPSVKFLMSRTADFDYILTDTEKEALLLENTLIKRHAPRYNVRMKDDKSYVCIRIDVQNRFPRVTIGRRFRKDAARFFGPYSSAKEVRRAVRLVHDVFPLRTCSEAVFKSRRRPCIQYEIGRCPGPCCGLIPETEYRRIVDSVILFLKGRNKELVDKIRADMKEAAARLDFERAAVLRDRIAAIETTLEKQKVAGAVGGENRDVFGFHRDGDTIAVTVLAFRSGQMSATDSFVFDRARQPVDEVMASFLPQFYGSGRRFVPREVMLPDMPEDVSGLEEFLSDLRGGKVRVYVPRRGEKVKLVNMAERNAAAAIVRHRHRAADTETALRELRDRLNLTRIPARIECFDISNTSGTLAVGSMATFTNGEPDKKRYRRYRVKTVKGSDDYAMMREVLMRRYRRAIEEDDMPD
ncbi:MAG: excinuclease ABC subunit UvrC, partial [Candidatus Hydrogenedentes bacterium]|nr:excinuclease ABC subunit UvrC [Candidatus Hydrogenedentota bacterium]